MKILVLGSTGMIGSAMYRVLSSKFDLEVWGTSRTPIDKQFFSDDLISRIITGVDVRNRDTLIKLFVNNASSISSS